MKTWKALWKTALLALLAFAAFAAVGCDSTGIGPFGVDVPGQVSGSF